MSAEAPMRGGTAADRPRTLRIGITGPIGCGKSTIAAALGQRGGVVVDADHLSHETTPPGSPTLAAIAERFGTELIAADGGLDRAALGRIVFADPSALRDLEAITQPAIRVLIERAVASAQSAGAPFVVVEAIKLVEAGYGASCDEVWLVTCTPDEQRVRLAPRATAGIDVERRMAIQGADLVERLRPHATRVIDGSGTREEVAERALAALDEALRAHRQPRS